MHLILSIEGQRRYIESLSSYIRQFLGKLQKPDVESINGISPASNRTKGNLQNPRSTVGTVTEIYDYLKLLYARIGKTYSPISGKEVKNQISDVVDFILNHEKETVCLLTTKIKNCEFKKLNTLLQQGYSRILINNKLSRINTILENSTTNLKDVYLVIDRVIIDTNKEENKSRIIDSVETSFLKGKENVLSGLTIKIIIFLIDLNLMELCLKKFNSIIWLFNNPYGSL